ncbi:AAA family ATPase [Corallococcus sp. 4LFB]|uniref:AAA family ATPase n=1 Tax=Corallococcus sp. 4LFB TaxID=3383249 RepID=UPI003975B3CE
MAHIKLVTIRRFKRLEEVEIPMTESTVLIGANNSGKSSVLQAVHFAVSVAQTSLLVGGVSWASDKYQLSFSPTQLLYSPVADVLTLASGGTLVEDTTKRTEIILTDASGDSCTVALRRGRNRNISISIEGRKLGERLQDLSSPFSVYAPGLAGVPKEEHYISPGLVRRAIARGDANLVLRNVLYQLSRTPSEWNQFHEDIQTLFPNLNIDVTFNQETDEYIRASVSIDKGPSLPLDAAGTAILQASQILSYATLFKPEILILDEPDSHLHPNNQRALCSLIFRLSQARGFQAIISTHSRHVLDAMRSRGNLVWLSQGAVVKGVEHEETKMLLDIGALDSIDYFANGTTRCVVATEDEDQDAVKQVLWSSGFVEDETEVVSYSGVSKLDAAIVLGCFLKEKAPNIRMVVHRDRDYISTEEATRFTESLKKNGIESFITAGNDIESQYLSTDHITSTHPGTPQNRVVELLEQARLNTKDKSLKSIINIRTDQAIRKRNKTGSSVDHGEIALQAQRDYDASPSSMARGKLVLNELKALLQKELGTNTTLIVPSQQLQTPDLMTIAAKIWPPKQPASSGPSGLASQNTITT